MKSTDILPLVTTPLALAALALLVGAGILRALLRKKNPRAYQSIGRNVFILALVFGVLANISFIITGIFEQEIRMAGTIRDETGRGLDRVLVELDGSARTMTLSDGTYQLIVPRARRATEYKIWVTLAGYQPHRETLPGPDLPRVFSVELKRFVFVAKDVIQTPSFFRLSHHLGNPIVDVLLQFNGPSGLTIRMTNLRAELIPEHGIPLALSMTGTYAPMTMQYAPVPMQEAPIGPDGPWRLQYRFVFSTAQPDSLLMRADQEWIAAQPITAAKPFRLSPNLLTDITKYREQAWKWTPGKWRFRIAAVFDGQALERNFDFELSPPEIAQLESTQAGYERGENLAWMTTFMNSAGIVLPLRD